MRRFAKLYFIFCLCFVTHLLIAGERTIPVDIFIMIDKSLSMEEPGKFDSLQRWVLDEFIDQMLITGDWITVYQFYEKPEHLVTMTIDDKNSMRRVYDTVKAIKPDGHFTDIGLALDTVQELLDKRGANGRFKVLLLLSDLIQDAPWTSKYRGKQASFQSPYLVEARTIKHDNWYEITLDMDIQDVVVQRTQSLYSDVLANEGLPRTDARQDKALVKGNTTVVTQTNEITGLSEETKKYTFGDNGSNKITETKNEVTDIGDKNSKSGNAEIARKTDSSQNAPNNNKKANASDNKNSNDKSSPPKTNFSNNESENNFVSTSDKDTNSLTKTKPTDNDVSNTNEDKTNIIGSSNNYDNQKTNSNKKAKTASGRDTSKSDKSFLTENWLSLLIGFGILILIIVIILLIIHFSNANNKAEKEKINLI